MRLIWIRYTLALAVVFFGLLAPQSVVAQVGIAAMPAADFDLKTSLRGSLQRRLQEAYPDSFLIGVDLFWEPHDGWVSQEVLDWWTLRVTIDDMEGINPESAKRMLWRISVESPVFERSERRRICAVVGASRNLLGSQSGELIDAHDFIFRINRAPTEKYEVDVGKDTTHHVTWPRELEEGQFDRDAFLLVSPVSASNPDIFDRIVHMAERELRWDFERVRIIHPAFVRYLHQQWTKDRGGYPSTGFIAQMVALHVCDEVNLFGFGADELGRWDRYYEDDPKNVKVFHATDFEGQLRRELEASGVLKAYRGTRLQLFPDPEDSDQK